MFGVGERGGKRAGEGEAGEHGGLEEGLGEHVVEQETTFSSHGVIERPW
jgi:hypothetical protein